MTLILCETCRTLVPMGEWQPTRIEAPVVWRNEVVGRVTLYRHAGRQKIIGCGKMTAVPVAV